MISCKKCNRTIIDATADGGWKLRTRMLLFNSAGTAVALCPTCKAEVPVPVTLGNIHSLPKNKVAVTP